MKKIPQKVLYRILQHFVYLTAYITANCRRIGRDAQMEFIDKVQERKDYEKTPEGKKKKRRDTICCTVLVLVVLIVSCALLCIEYGS